MSKRLAHSLSVLPANERLNSTMVRANEHRKMELKIWHGMACFPLHKSPGSSRVRGNVTLSWTSHGP
uniref:Uncharacterized protein n=1 Tax=Helianthus annuus TaxID=4232 RepID=A0A251TFQ6_HELAN